MENLRANELRIGNLVELAIKMEGSLIERCRVKDNILEVNKEFIFGELNTFCNPIPLTEEWLLKFGAINLQGRPNKQYRIGERIIMERGEFFYDYATNVKLEYVHTFQNLIFALTQTELEIK